jgi:hypothetical protein
VAALAETVYARPGLRHCDTIDLFVRPDDLGRAARALASSGFALRTAPPKATPPAYRLRHDVSGLPLTVGAALFGSAAPVPAQDVWSRVRPLPTLGVPAAVPSPADLLIHVLARAAMERSRDTLVWASDAVLTLRASPSLDWTVAIAAARRSGLALPVWVLLEWLATALEAPVPAPALDTWRAEARTAGPWPGNWRSPVSGQVVAVLSRACSGQAAGDPESPYSAGRSPRPPHPCGARPASRDGPSPCSTFRGPCGRSGPWRAALFGDAASGRS